MKCAKWATPTSAIASILAVPGCRQHERVYAHARPLPVSPCPTPSMTPGAALLEPLGVGIHAVDLAKIKVGDRLQCLAPAALA